MPVSVALAAIENSSRSERADFMGYPVREAEQVPGARAKTLGL
jgi:hypothetical protein